MPTDRESFWDHENFALVTDGTKPAMKWAVEELRKRGKNLHVVDMSGKPLTGSVRNIGELPMDIDCAVIGVTTTEPAQLMDELMKKGISRFWIHWYTETPRVKELCRDNNIQCITGRCPMMYLGHGISIHTMHRGFVKLIGKY